MTTYNHFFFFSVALINYFLPVDQLGHLQDGNAGDEIPGQLLQNIIT